MFFCCLFPYCIVWIRIRNQNTNPDRRKVAKLGSNLVRTIEFLILHIYLTNIFGSFLIFSWVPAQCVHISGCSYIRDKSREVGITSMFRNHCTVHCTIQSLYTVQYNTAAELYTCTATVLYSTAAPALDVPSFWRLRHLLHLVTHFLMNFCAENHQITV